MTDSTGKAQGLAVDNLRFSALQQKLAVTAALFVLPGRSNFVVSWPSLSALRYQLEYTTNLSSVNWQSLGAPVPGNGATLMVTNAALPVAQSFYRLKILP